MVLSSINLNDRGSAKETYHIEVEAEGVDYEPGDSIGIVPENPVAIVDAIINTVRIANDYKITWKDGSYNLFDFLKTKPAVQYLHERVVKNMQRLLDRKYQKPKWI